MSAKRRSPACTRSSCVPRASRSAAGGWRSPTSAATSSRTSPSKAPNDALLAVLAKLDDFRGDSRFTTWAYKFALLEAAVSLRRRAWQGREIPVEGETWTRLEKKTDGSPSLVVERAELMSAIREAIETALTPRQREVLVAAALNEVPIDVLAEREGTTRGAVYKMLHDARRKLRAELARKGLAPGDAQGGGG